MARLAGVDLPREKRLEIALTYIYGVGRTRALATLDPGRPKPGFAKVEDADGRWLTSAAALSSGQSVRLVFGDGARDAVVEGEPRPAPPAPARPAPRAGGGRGRNRYRSRPAGR